MSDGRISRRRLLASLGTGIGVVGTAGCTTGDPGTTATRAPTSATPSGEGGRIHVSPAGSGDNPGTREAPLGAIRQGLREAHPGDTVVLAPGDYHENLRTVRGGAPGKPITITGPPDAVWRPRRDDPGTPLEVVHSHVHVTGIAMSGLVDDSRAFESLDVYGQPVVHVSPAARHRSDRYEPVDYLEGIVFEPARIGHSGSNMIFVTRLRDSTIGGFRVVGPAGVHYHPKLPGTVESHVGEVIYLGSGPDDIFSEAYPYPWDGLDRTRNVRIHHIDNRAGYHHSELVDIKLGCSDVTVEYCTDRGAGEQTDGAEAGAIAAKGNDCTIRWNDIGDCPVGVEFDPYAPVEQVDVRNWASDNAVYGNHIHDYSAAAFRFQAAPSDWNPGPEDQRVLCGNRIEGDGTDTYSYATDGCDEEVPEGDGIGHTGGDSPWA